MNYRVHMITLQYKDTTGYATVHGDGSNCIDEHIEAIEAFLEKLKADREARDLI